VRIRLKCRMGSSAPPPTRPAAHHRRPPRRTGSMLATLVARAPAAAAARRVAARAPSTCAAPRAALAPRCHVARAAPPRLSAASARRAMHIAASAQSDAAPQAAGQLEVRSAESCPRNAKPHTHACNALRNSVAAGYARAWMILGPRGSLRGGSRRRQNARWLHGRLCAVANVQERVRGRRAHGSYQRLVRPVRHQLCASAGRLLRRTQPHGARGASRCLVLARASARVLADVCNIDTLLPCVCVQRKAQYKSAIWWHSPAQEAAARAAVVRTPCCFRIMRCIARNTRPHTTPLTLRRRRWRRSTA
jgi:hypothetical protein